MFSMAFMLSWITVSISNKKIIKLPSLGFYPRMLLKSIHKFTFWHPLYLPMYHLSLFSLTTYIWCSALSQHPFPNYQGWHYAISTV